VSLVTNVTYSTPSTYTAGSVTISYK
jgi:hypothetical protein